MIPFNLKSLTSFLLLKDNSNFQTRINVFPLIFSRHCERDQGRNKGGVGRAALAAENCEEIRFGQKREITRYVVSARAKVHLAYPGYSSVRRVHAVRVEGKRAGSWPGSDGGGQQDEGEGGGNPRREPSNLVPSRLEVCKNKREKRVRATCPGAPPIGDPSRLVAVPAKITPLAPPRAILSGRRGWPTAAAIVLEISRFFSPIRFLFSFPSLLHRTISLNNLWSR